MNGRRLLDLAGSFALLAYPRSFRQRFGAEMKADFARGRPDLGTLCAFVAAGLAERASAVRRVLLWSGDRPHLYDPRWREGRHAMSWDTLRSDLRHTLRMARKAPAFTALVVLALALGIGANSVIFTVVNSVLLEPLPYRDPDRLAMVWSHATLDGRPRNPTSPANFRDFASMNTTLEGLEAYYSFVTPLQLQSEIGTEVAHSVMVTPGLFPLLGREAARGRTFSPADGDGAVVLSDGYWRRRFGADPSVIGRTLQFSGRPRVVVGVMPPDFVFPYGQMLGPSGFTRVRAIDVWAPIVYSGPQAVAHRMLTPGGDLTRAVHWFGAIGRLRPGVGLDQARADLKTVAARLEQTYPDSNKGWSATVVPVHEQAIGSVRPALWVLSCGVGVVLLMAAVNVASLLLARGLARQKELATRVALGAGRRRMIQQALTESLLLACGGGVLGLLAAWGGVHALVALAPSSLPRMDEVSPDGRVLLVTIAVTLLTGLAAGLLPAWSAASANPIAALQEQSRGTTGGGQAKRRLRSGLVIAEVALAAILATGTGLLLRSFVALLDLDPGFRSENILTWQMDLPERLRTPDERRAFYADYFPRLRALPGVTAVGGTTRLPLGSTSVSTTVDIEGKPRPAAELPEVEMRRNLEDYFTAMGIPLLRGRLFTPEDGPESPPVAVINATLAARLFGADGGDPLGQRVRLGPSPGAAWMEIVGVVGDIRHATLEAAPAPELYVNYRQNPPVSPFLVMRTAGDPAQLADAVRAMTRSLDKDLVLRDLRTMEEVRAASIAERRFLLFLASSFGLLALSLAAIGVYGVLSTTVSERTQEVGIRMALGARPVEILRMVIGQAGQLTLAGVLLGLLVVLPLTPLLRGQLFGVAPVDPLTVATVPLVLLFVALLAAALPARRAMRVDTMQALRNE